MLEAAVKPHGQLLERKAGKVPALIAVKDAYRIFVESARELVVTSRESVLELTEAFNLYRRESIYIFEGGKNVPQENFRSTIMEEFLAWLFKDIFDVLDFDKPSNFKIGKSNNSYLELTFAPRSFKDIFQTPNPRIHKKDQDFVLGAYIKISIDGADQASPAIEKILLPVVAIECKTYLAKNHLDMCSSTAASLRRAMPYCMYIIVAEFLKMDRRVVPEFTDISEIFVLCKAKNTERVARQKRGLPPHDIDPELVWQLYEMVLRHLKSIWWDPLTAVQRGRIINRP